MSVRFRAGSGCILLLVLGFGCGKVTRNPTMNADGDTNGDAGAPTAAGGDISAQGGSLGGGIGGATFGGANFGGATMAGAAPGGSAGQCGDGKKDPPEACDLGVENGAPTSCCNIVCELSPIGKVCRPGALDQCDPLEICDGAHPVCPPDKREPDGAPCQGNGISDCSGPDVCMSGVCSNNDVTAGGAASGCCALSDPPKLVVDIIESESMNATHAMDVNWQAVAQDHGFIATIHPQTYLDDVASLLNTGVLVIASGLIDLPANRVATIQSFVQAGGGVYLQGEYSPSFGPNQAFSQIVNATGGKLSWVGEVEGNLNPVQILGCWANTAEQVMPLNYFWYGATATTTAEVIAKSSTGVPVGWSWCLPGPGNGQIVQITDQDTFNKELAPEDKALIHNILTRLAYAKTCD